MLNRPSFYLALVGIIAITLIVVRLRRGDPLSQPLVPPPQSPFAQSVGARGIIESLHENVRISPTVAGRIETVAVNVGDRVKKGDVLFVVDARDAISEIKMMEAQLTVLDARMRETETQLADRRDQFDRSTKLREKAVASEDETKRNDFAWQAAQRQLVRVQADYQLGKAQLENAGVQRDLLTVRAPRDGAILQVNIREGEYATVTPGGDPLILLGDIATYQLRADIDESDATRVRPVAKPSPTSKAPAPIPSP